MFASGQSALANAIFSLLTFSVAIPSAVKVFNWVATMWKGSISLATPMLYVMQVIFVFLVGGLTGLFLGALSTDIHFHDTYFVVAHFHYVMMGTTLFALLAAIYYWYPKMFGRMYHERTGQIAACIIAVGFNLTFFIQFVAGAQGMPRRYATYEPQYEIYHKISTVGSWVLGAGLVLVLINWIMGRWGKIAPPNPWGANTLEWQTSSPPPHDNFKVTPAAGDPYALKRWRWVESDDPKVANGWELKPEFRAKAVAAGPGHRDSRGEDDPGNGGQLIGQPHYLTCRKGRFGALRHTIGKTVPPPHDRAERMTAINPHSACRPRPPTRTTTSSAATRTRRTWPTTSTRPNSSSTRRRWACGPSSPPKSLCSAGCSAPTRSTATTTPTSSASANTTSTRPSGRSTPSCCSPAR